MSNPAFERARADGIIDTFLSMPTTRDQLQAHYGWVRAATMDSGSRAMEMPAEHLFKDNVPKYDELPDPVDVVLAQMDHFGIRQMVVGYQQEEARRALREHPDRFVGMAGADPLHGTEGVRKLASVVRAHDLRCAHVFPAGLVPQVPIDDARMYPIYAACVDLGIPIITYAGVPGPRIPFTPQEVARLDEVCWYFPDLTVVVRHGGEPWTDLMAKLLLKWPNLYYSTSAFAPKYYPPAIVEFANTRGADKILYAGYYAAGLPLERVFAELPGVPFRDHVWPKFLRENARRVFRLTG